MSDRAYYVYVVELAGGRPPGDVYVGSSALPPTIRFRHHLTSAKGSRHVRRRGVRLLPRLYARLNPLPTRRAAERAEKRIRNALEHRGYRVFGSCYQTEEPECWL